MPYVIPHGRHQGPGPIVFDSTSSPPFFPITATFTTVLQLTTTETLVPDSGTFSSYFPVISNCLWLLQGTTSTPTAHIPAETLSIDISAIIVGAFGVLSATAAPTVLCYRRRRRHAKSITTTQTGATSAHMTSINVNALMSSNTDTRYRVTSPVQLPLPQGLPGHAAREIEEAGHPMYFPSSNSSMRFSSRVVQDPIDDGAIDVLTVGLPAISNSSRLSSLGNSNNSDLTYEPHSHPPSYSSRTTANVVYMQLRTEYNVEATNEGRTDNNSNHTSVTAPSTHLPLYETPSPSLLTPSFHTVDETTNLERHQFANQVVPKNPS